MLAKGVEVLRGVQAAAQPGHSGLESRLCDGDFHRSKRLEGFGGELSSFFFAYTGEFAPGMDRFFGATVDNAFHAPAVPASPGSALAHSLYRGRLTATHVAQGGVLSADEGHLLRDTLVSDLVGRTG